MGLFVLVAFLLQLKVILVSCLGNKLASQRLRYLKKPTTPTLQAGHVDKRTCVLLIYEPPRLEAHAFHVLEAVIHRDPCT